MIHFDAEGNRTGVSKSEGRAAWDDLLAMAVAFLLGTIWFSLLFLIVPAVMILLGAEALFLRVQNKDGIGARVRDHAAAAWAQNMKVVESIRRNYQQTRAR